MSVILFIIILLALVIGHEAGHFSVAKWVGMKVLEFGVGFPPKLWGRRVGETEYTVNALPFGGFVRIFGEDESEKFEERAFARHTKAAQAAVLFAGPFANIVLGFLAFWIALMIGVPAVIAGSTTTDGLTNTRVAVAEVLPHGPAALAGVRTGDTIESFTIDGASVPITKPEDIAALIKEHHTITVSLVRGGQHLSVPLIAQAGIIPEFPDRFGVGIATILVGTKMLGPVAAFIEAGTQTATGLWSVATGLAGLIGSVFTLSASLADVSGPVGIAGLVGDAASFGAGQVLMLAAVISLNLAVLNLLPFPALDGGRILMLAIETVRGRTIKTSTTQLINTVGFIFIILLMLVVTWHDIAKLLM